MLGTVELPNPFDVRVLCDRIAAQRGRPIYLHPTDGISGTEAPCGTWLATDVGDHIFYEAATSPLHQTHIILHELSHMLLGHRSVLSGAAAPASNVFGSDIDPKTIQSMLARAAYTTADERDAEQLASLIADRVSLAPSTATVGRHDVLRRLHAALRAE